MEGYRGGHDEPRGQHAAPELDVSSRRRDGRVVSVENFQTQNQYPYPCYRIVIEHSCDLYPVFIHVGSLQGALKRAESGGKFSGPVPVKAGDVISDDSDHPGFDFSTFDRTHKLALANPASYSQAESWKQYTADPFT